MTGTVASIPTRPRCHACRRVMIIDFLVPDQVWRLAVHPALQNGYLCIDCFASCADERRIDWAADIVLVPLSFAYQIQIQDRAAAGDFTARRPKCLDCWLPYDSPRWVEAVVSDADWERILPGSGGGGLLCIGCMAARFAAIGVDNVPVLITAGPFIARHQPGEKPGG